MKQSVLWIDDVPDYAVLARKCMLNLGLDVVVANSAEEAMQRIGQTHYDALFLKPDLKLEGNSTVCLDELNERNKTIPLFRKINSAIGKSASKHSPLYLMVFGREFDDESKGIKDALKSEGVDIHGKQPCVVYMGNDNVVPASFAYEIKGSLIKRALTFYERSRAESRVDG